jgi:hypothetical protein
MQPNEKKTGNEAVTIEDGRNFPFEPADVIGSQLQVGVACKEDDAAQAQEQEKENPDSSWFG